MSEEYHEGYRSGYENGCEDATENYRKLVENRDARIAKLEAALRPFADMADEYDAAFPRPLNICLAEYPEDYLLWCQARAALGEKK
ncbi:hypothetical protein [Caudoviricetes sp.]|nr:hypothetical protein [Caudoviricetes sp.]UOF81518.1 hypothetical protein [Caudoviricetes sp.]